MVFSGGCSCFCFTEGRASLHQSIYCSTSLMLSTSSHQLCHQAENLVHPVTPHTAVTLLPPITTERLPCSLQPETWTAACFHGSSVCIVTSFVVSMGNTASCWVEIIANLQESDDHQLNSPLKQAELSAPFSALPACELLQHARNSQRLLQEAW